MKLMNDLIHSRFKGKNHFQRKMWQMNQFRNYFDTMIPVFGVNGFVSEVMFMFGLKL